MEDGHLVEQRVSGGARGLLHVPIGILGLLHAINSVGKPGVEEREYVGTRVVQIIVLHLTHGAFLPAISGGQIPRSLLRLLGEVVVARMSAYIRKSRNAVRGYRMAKAPGKWGLTAGLLVTN